MAMAIILYEFGSGEAEAHWFLIPNAFFLPTSKLTQPGIFVASLRWYAMILETEHLEFDCDAEHSVTSSNPNSWQEKYATANDALSIDDSFGQMEGSIRVITWLWPRCHNKSWLCLAPRCARDWVYLKISEISCFHGLQATTSTSNYQSYWWTSSWNCEVLTAISLLQPSPDPTILADQDPKIDPTSWSPGTSWKRGNPMASPGMQWTWPSCGCRLESQSSRRSLGPSGEPLGEPPLRRKRHQGADTNGPKTGATIHQRTGHREWIVMRGTCRLNQWIASVDV